MMDWTYILKCADDTYYCGWTNDIKKRLASHNAGTASKYTRTRRPVKLVYLELSGSKKEAMSREWHIKRLSRAEKTKLIELSGMRTGSNIKISNLNKKGRSSDMTKENEKLMAQLSEKQLESETIFNGRILHVVKDRVELPNGHISTREVIRHIGAACVIPVTDDGKVITERQYRYPYNEVITEIPAGKLDSDEEDPLDAAKRELIEETGYTADKWTFLGMFYPAAAYCDEAISMYLAEGLHKGEQKLDDDEFLTFEEIPLTQLVDEVMAGLIPDSKTQTAILKAARILGV